MRLGVFTSSSDLTKPRPWIYPPSADDDEKVIFHLRPWTRSALEVVEKRAKAKNIAVMDADFALRAIGGKDRKGEAYLRELADYIIDDWENVVFASPFTDPDTGTVYEEGDPMPCNARNKIFLFENTQLAVDLVAAAKTMGTIDTTDEAKNSERSSAGTPAPVSLPSQTSA